MNINIEELEQELIRKRAEREKTLKDIKRLDRLAKMPFYLRIQQEGEEKWLKRVEETQLDTMSTAWKRWNVPKEECEDLGREFFTEFLAGEIASIDKFLKSRGYKRLER